MIKIRFYKMHGAGNDFVCIDNREGKIKLVKEEIIFLCDRHFGVGADGIILMEKNNQDENEGDIFMNYWNADGSPAEMCGNGARCTAHFTKEIWNLKKDIIKVMTRSGVKEVAVQNNNLFTVNMGQPILEHSDFPKTCQQIENIEWHFVSMGNPHAVGFLENQEIVRKNLEKVGSKVENDTEKFPQKINVNFVTQKGTEHFSVDTWERGCGATLACGTGASAAFTQILQKFPELKNQKIQIDVPGGILFFELNEVGEILMTGPSKFVFQGEVELK